MSQRKKITVYTDGACSKNPGPGGWCAILLYNNNEKVISGCEQSTTNNRMEMTGVISALSALKEPCDVTLYTDSEYIVNAIIKGWAKKWQANNWKKSDKKTALNIDLWEKLLSIIENHNIEFIWVKGHAENEYNNRCDKIAVDCYKKLIGEN